MRRLVISWLRAFSALLCLLALATPSSACQPLADDQQDNFSDPGALLVRARVKSFEMHTTGSTFCQKISYDVLETFRGSPPDPFELESCVDDFVLTLDDETKRMMEDDLGFVTGAEVLALYTSNPPKKGMGQGNWKPGQLRPMVWNCWGFYHFRLDLMPSDARAEFMEQWKGNLEKE